MYTDLSLLYYLHAIISQISPEQVRAQLAAQQQRTIVIQGDGNCLFRALAFIIYKTEEVHSKMRQLLVDFVTRNKCSFRPFVDGSVEEHVGQMRYMRKWGTALEILAAASLLQIPIYTYTPSVQGTYKWLRYMPLTESTLQFPEEPYPRHAKFLNHIELLHASACHYDCIVFIDGGFPMEEPRLA